MKSVALMLLNVAALPALAAAPVTSVAPPPVITPAAPAAQLTLSDDGQSVLLDGTLEKGVADKFRAVLDAAPKVRTVVLQSDGGRLGEAMDISAIVRARGLATYVESWCLSACTVILLAGRDRAASPTAKIGFHGPIFPGAKPSDIPTLRSMSRRLYDDAGVQPTFTDRAFATAASDMWFPSADEMQVARVLTRISLSGETMAGASQLKSRDDIAKALAVIPFWPDLKTRYPEVTTAMIEEAWLAKRAGRNDNEIASAGRAVLIKNYHRILAAASDGLLSEYLDLVIDQAEAARALSFEACDKAFKGQLDISRTLPKPLIDREVALMSKVLASSAPPVKRTVTSVETLLGPLYQRLPADQVQALAATGDDYSKSARCDGMIAMLREIRMMPAAKRAQVTQAMFLSE